jgi:hypothetical protein
MTPRVLVPAVEILLGWRVVAAPAALDSGRFPVGALVLRFAPDDVLIVGEGVIAVDDPHAIVEPDHGWCALAVSENRALEILAHHAAWSPPTQRPALAQGMVAGLAAKVFLDGERSLIIVTAPYAAELERRLA